MKRKVNYVNYKVIVLDDNLVVVETKTVDERFFKEIAHINHKFTFPFYLLQVVEVGEDFVRARVFERFSLEDTLDAW